MERKIRENIEQLFKNYPELNQVGLKTEQSIFQKLKRKVKNQIPDWYVELLTEFPIAELKIGIPFNYGWETLKSKKQNELPFMPTEFNSIENIEFIATEEFPGFELIKENYICIAEETNKGGDGFYINAKVKNPSVIYIYHDCGNDASELIKNGQSISSSFSDFLKVIRPSEFADKWLNENEHLWK
ncbi:SMI1/KNR4 family protein [Mesoflavibacter profundi]|uniref:SMI1/KNR4 family protein n=1 Tax=Mesoflavibacter profundi TaxID=2708110 RepID=UPI00168A56C6|nr:SMI1/KNR4 family protein [Mesoflavibacter profundi]